MAQSDSPFAEYIDFKAFSQEIVAVKDADGIVNKDRPQVTGIGSSELEDLAGDRMMMTALEDMATFSIRSPIFMNHRYNVPNDVFGGLQRIPSVKQMPPGGPGLLNSKSPYGALEIAVDVAKSNPTALQSFGIISDDNIRLGFSIGCRISEFDVRKDENEIPLGFDILHVEPLEWSLVGIPCNQQSWVQNAAKGIYKRYSAVPPASTPEEAMYINKHYLEFDDITALYIHRSFPPKIAEFIKSQQTFWDKYGLELSYKLSSTR